MSDRYTAFVGSGPGAAIAAKLGLPRPVELRRWAPGDPLVEGPVLLASLGGGRVGEPAAPALRAAGVEVAIEVPENDRLGGVILDASGATSPGELEGLQALLAPAVKRLGRCARVIVVGADPAQLTDSGHRAAQRALEGFVRSLGKELRSGATANLILLDDGAADTDLLAAVFFLLSGRSAYVCGQVLTIGPSQGSQEPADPDRPLAGRTAVVTGAARGIGAVVARVLARDGARVLAVDVAAAGESLAAVANEIRGAALHLDITSADAGDRLSAHPFLTGGLDIMVHNAGITRDKLLVNMGEDRWNSVLAVNLESQLRMDDALLAGPLHDGSRLISVSSMAGIAGNRGQTNYAAAKAGVIGMVQARAQELAARRMTYNAVAPGFIETDMTARIPFATREIGRRLNSLSQGGRPVDVAEAIGFFAHPATAGITGQVLRVCGQSLLGA